MPENQNLIEEVKGEKPQIVFGVVADIQYADVDDLVQYGRKRFYRNSLKLLQNALTDWRDKEKENDFKIKFILQLGDLIDGYRTNLSNICVDKCLKNVLDQFELNNYPSDSILHIWGNHELFAYKRHELSNSILNTSKLLKQNIYSSNSNYYFYDINERLRLICMDQYEISTLGYLENDEEYKQAKHIFEKYAELRKIVTDTEEKRFLNRYLLYNGGVGEKQMKWLEDQLNICKKLSKKVILCGHIPLTDKASDSCAVWNGEEILNLLWSYDNLVLAYLAGHYHPGGYFLDHKNIHHLTLNSILETPLESNNAYMTVYVYENRIEFKNQIESRSFSVFY